MELNFHAGISIILALRAFYRLVQKTYYDFLAKKVPAVSSTIVLESYLKEFGSLITFDDQAVRLWDLQNQIKSYHANFSEDKLRFMKMIVLEKINCILLVFSIKKRQGEGGLIRIFSSSLKILQEVFDFKICRIF